MIKINKTKARKLYNEGVKVYCLPCKVIYNNPWFSNVYISKDSGEEFDNITSRMTYYNCNSEVGYYLSYYVK